MRKGVFLGYAVCHLNPPPPPPPPPPRPRQYPITAVTGHQNIAPSRKTDPGHFFDWAQIGGCDSAQAV